MTGNAQSSAAIADAQRQYPAARPPADERPDGRPATSRHGGISRPGLPGSLDHASAEVDEFDAALVAGAEGVPATRRAPTPRSPGASRPTRTISPSAKSRPRPRHEGDLSADELQEPAGAGAVHAGHARAGFRRARPRRQPRDRLPQSKLGRAAARPVAGPAPGQPGDGRRDRLRRHRRCLSGLGRLCRQGNRRIHPLRSAECSAGMS